MGHSQGNGDTEGGVVNARRERVPVRGPGSRWTHLIAPRTGLALLLSVSAVGLVACSSKSPAGSSPTSQGSSTPTGPAAGSGSGPSGSSPGVTATSVTV